MSPLTNAAVRGEQGSNPRLRQRGSKQGRPSYRFRVQGSSCVWSHFSASHVQMNEATPAKCWVLITVPIREGKAETQGGENTRTRGRALGSGSQLPALFSGPCSPVSLLILVPNAPFPPHTLAALLIENNGDTSLHSHGSLASSNPGGCREQPQKEPVDRKIDSKEP